MTVFGFNGKIKLAYLRRTNMSKTIKITISLILVVAVAIALFFVFKNIGSDSFTVTFVSNGGTNIASQQVKSGEKLTLEIPTKKDHLFLGWFTDSTLKESFDSSKEICEDITLYASWLDISDKTDTDGDKLTDALEAYYGTDKENIDTDGDLLSDYWEIVLSYNPLLGDTDGNGTKDSDEDYDGDSITNMAEIGSVTSPVLKDTDGDTLSDYDEINTHKTSPILLDTDNDGANDDWEILNSFNPNEPNTSFSVKVENNGATVKMNADGKAASSISIEKIEMEESVAEISGFLNTVYDFSTDGEFESATITLDFEGDVSDNFQPRIYYFNEAEQIFEELENQVIENNTVRASVNHFSQYALFDKIAYDKIWVAVPKSNEVSTFTADADGISDYYTELIKNGELLSSKGENLFKNVDFGAKADFDNDGLLNGEEIVIVEDGYLGRTYYILKTNPLISDTDGDGMIDSLDPNPSAWDVSLRDLALLSHIVYKGYDIGTILSNVDYKSTVADTSNVAGSSKELKGWRVVYYYNDFVTGYQSSIYQKGNNVVIATRGSAPKGTSFGEKVKDWAIADVIGYLGGFNSQVLSMELSMKKVAKVIGKEKNIYVTGHSLGGYLTLMTASQLVEKGYKDSIKLVTTYNGLGLTVNPVGALLDIDDNVKLSKISDRILNYRTQTDFVSTLGYRVGTEITVPVVEKAEDAHKLTSFLERFSNDIRHPSYDAFRNGLNDDGKAQSIIKPPVNTETDTSIDTDTNIDTDKNIDTDTDIDTDTIIDTDTNIDTPPADNDPPTEEIKYSQGLEWQPIYSGSSACQITGIGTCTDTVIYIPEEIEGYRVEEIGSSAFAYNEKITGVVLGNVVTTIGAYAFSNCSKLENIEFGNNMTIINDGAFERCINLWNLKLPWPIYHIGSNAFVGCTSLSYIHLDNNECTNYLVSDNCLIERKTGVLVLGAGSSVIPNDGTVNKIGEYAFFGRSGLKSITIPSSVKEIGAFAFTECSELESITIENGVEIIGRSAFSSCESLKQATIPSSVAEMGDSLFMSCYELISVTYAEGNTLSEIGEYMFYGCVSLEGLYNAPMTITKIGNNAFAYCSSLVAIVVLPNVATLGEYAFYECVELKNVTFGEGSVLKKIGDYAFDGCVKLESIQGVPVTIEEIGFYAFAHCVSLKSVYYHGEVNQGKMVIVKRSWNEGTPSFTIYCSDGKLTTDDGTGSSDSGGSW